MFIGHFGVGFGAKKIAKKISLGWLFLASQFLDLLWPTLILLNIEKADIKPGLVAANPLQFTYYPYSHSLLMALVWSILFGGIYWLVTKQNRSAVVIGFCVISHWLLDFVVHVPDLPLLPDNSLKVGAGLWNSLLLSQVAEGIVFIAGLYLYVHTTKAKNKLGKISLWLLTALLILSHLGNIFGPPPTSIKAVAVGAELMWIFVLLAFWTDRNRTDKIPTNEEAATDTAVHKQNN